MSSGMKPFIEQRSLIDSAFSESRNNNEVFAALNEQY